MTDDGVLVSRKWLEKVDALLFGGSVEETTPPKGGKSLFYLARPAVLTSSWTEISSYLHKAKAKFLRNDGSWEEKEIEVWSTFPANERGGQYQRGFAILRGRWEWFDGYNQSTPYTSGAGISIASSVISNTGLLSAGVGNGATRSGDLKFNEQHFDWGTSSVSGVNGICIKSSLFPAPSLSASVSGNEITITLEV